MRPAAVLACLLALGQPVERPEDARDAITLANGKRIEGRIVQIHDEEFVYIREPGRREPERTPRRDVAGVDPLVRERLAQWLDLRRPTDDVQQRWVLAQRARALGLPAMARLEAYGLLADDPSFGPAHELLGHRKARERWEWSLDTTGERAERGKRAEFVDADEFHERLRDWQDRLVLESENWRLETNASLHQGVQVLLDLERAYCGWMQHFGERLGAAELPWDPDQRMVVCVFRNAADGFTQNLSDERLPYYSSSFEQVVGDSPNVVFTYYAEAAQARPRELFELALQQLMFTTLALGHKRAAPPNVEHNHWAHWIELGFSSWAADHIDGAPGYATFPEPVAGVARKIDKSLARTALLRARDSSLSNPRKELANLVGMPWMKFYIDGQDGAIHRAKAKTFVAYLMSESPPVVQRAGAPPVGRAGDGVFTYLREVFGTPKAHSSSALDEALGGRVEQFTAGWKQWLSRMAF